MFMKANVKLGPTGIPARCKGSSIDAVRFIANEGLQAMEVNFVRGVKMRNEMAIELGDVAKQCNIDISVHAPFYINLASHDKKIQKDSVQRIKDSLERAHHMGAKVVVVHAGYYGEHGLDKTHKIILEHCQNISDYIISNKWKVKLGLETTAKKKQYGTIDEINSICRKVKRAVPVIDFGHLFAKQGGAIDYSNILDKLKHHKHIHSHFSNMKRNKKGGYSDIHLPMNNAPPFPPLAKEIIKRKLDITIISESPITDLDSLKMKKVFEKLGYKF